MIQLQFRAQDEVRISISKMPISSQNPMFDHLLESSHPWRNNTSTVKSRYLEVVGTIFYKFKLPEVQMNSTHMESEKTEKNKRAIMALDRSPEMLKKTNYRTKIWPSELLFYPASGSGDDF